MKRDFTVWLFLTFIFQCVNSYSDINIPASQILKKGNVKREIWDVPPWSLKPLKSKDIENLTIDVRILNRGYSNFKETLEEQIKYSELIFSQCKGVNFKINLIDELDTEFTNAQGNFSFWNNDLGKFWLAEGFFKFFDHGIERVEQVIDIHIVDHLSNIAREEVKNDKPISVAFLGKAFSRISFEEIYASGTEELEHAKHIGGDSLVLALETLKFAKGNFIGIRKNPRSKKFAMRWKSHGRSLLAHELGHILVEDSFRDHWCPSKNSGCDRENLMSSGGAAEDIFVEPNNETLIIGYSPLPQLESEQCEILKAHPFVYKTERPPLN